MKFSRICFLVVFTCLAVGCDDVDIVDKTKSVVLKRDEYNKLKADAELGKSVGRYQIHREGTRTWRLDTATGKICLMLTSQYDWDHDAKDQTSCATEDAQSTRSNGMK